MEDPKNGSWYYCPTCFNYSKKPMECCGEMMLRDELDEEEAKVVEDENSPTNVEY